MAKSSKEVLILEVQARHSLWREDDVHFRRKDVNSKLWDEVVAACGMMNGK
jgi:hypothetical protein